MYTKLVYTSIDDVHQVCKDPLARWVTRTDNTLSNPCQPWGSRESKGAHRIKLLKTYGKDYFV